MSSPASAPARLLRAGLTSLWACLAACVSHMVGSGEPPPLVALVPVVPAVVALAWCASRRRWGTCSVLGLLVVPQLAVHLLSAYVHGHAPVPTLAMSVAHAVGLVVLAASIARAESFWWAWWARVTGLLSMPWRPLPPFAGPSMIGAGVVGVHGSALAHVLVRRGPPLS